MLRLHSTALRLSSVPRQDDVIRPPSRVPPSQSRVRLSMKFASALGSSPSHRLHAHDNLELNGALVASLTDVDTREQAPLIVGHEAYLNFPSFPESLG